MIRVLNLSEAVKRVKTTADTTSYMRISKEPILDSKFLVAARPFVFPLLLKLSGNDSEKAVWAQGLFSILSWSALAWAVASSLHFSFLKFAGFVLILLLSLYRYIIGWELSLADRVFIAIAHGLVYCRLAVATTGLALAKSAFCADHRVFLDILSRHQCMGRIDDRRLSPRTRGCTPN